MKTVLLLVALCLSLLAQAEGIQKCRAVGDEAVKVMHHRQGADDFFGALEEFSDQSMVMAAFERPRYDALSSLTTLIDAQTATRRQIANVRYEEVSSQLKNEISLFKMKYIKLCMRLKF